MFLEQRIELGGGIGLDIWIFRSDEDWLIGCTHNDEIFFGT
jgi:hypothetical protein